MTPPWMTGQWAQESHVTVIWALSPEMKYEQGADDHSLSMFIAELFSYKMSKKIYFLFVLETVF